jgi:hypothetical protein
MKITKNVLFKNDLKEFLKLINSDNFPWYYNDKTAHIKSNINSKHTYEAPQMTHKLIHNGEINSDWLKIMSPILDNIYKDIDINGIIRMKFNLLFPYKYKKNEKHCTPHIDNEEYKGNRILLFYPEDCDCYTYFFKNKKVWKKVKVTGNTLIDFDGKIYHAGSHPVKNTKKIVLNINYM